MRHDTCKICNGKMEYNKTGRAFICLNCGHEEVEVPLYNLDDLHLNGLNK